MESLSLFANSITKSLEDNMKFSSVKRILVTSAMLAMGLFGTTVSAQTLKIGLIGPMTGPGAAWGFAAKGAMQTLASEANAKGGLEVGGKKYQVEIVA